MTAFFEQYFLECNSKELSNSELHLPTTEVSLNKCISYSCTLLHYSISLLNYVHFYSLKPQTLTSSPENIVHRLVDNDPSELSCTDTRQWLCFPLVLLGYTASSVNHYKRVIGAGLTLISFAPFHMVCALKILLHARKVKTRNNNSRAGIKTIVIYL